MTDDFAKRVRTAPDREGLIRAPFSPEQVEALNAYQASGRFHPFTCGNDRGSPDHRAYADANGLGGFGILTATREGWLCPACGYRQDWAHGFMAKPLPPDPFAEATS